MVWALVNLVIAWLLLTKIGNFDLRDTGDALAAGLGIALFASPSPIASAATMAATTRESLMPLSQLDPIAALVIIDLQKGVLGMPTEPPTSLVLERSARLAAAFRARNLPVVLVNVSGRAPGRTANPNTFTPPPGWDELAPELDAQAADIRVTKYNIGAFRGTGLDMQLRRRGVTQIFLTGVATSSGVRGHRPVSL